MGCGIRSISRLSVYMTPPVTAWLAPKLELAVTDDLLCGVVFVLGLTAMNIIPALKAAMGVVRHGARCLI
ncbi:TPA: hypothetical protein QEM63_005209 [Pseudomonas putida]|nr:hypothetical protein AC138_16855 [Pseudomonas putida]KMY34802.1 hypothetical protein AA993_12925 [Pseudomonas putida]MBP2838487.1 hypothetical protein [Pseudomonas sp. PNP]HDS1720918.1 hypothetical protein [Pseudomonas putida]